MIVLWFKKHTDTANVTFGDKILHKVGYKLLFAKAWRSLVAGDEHPYWPRGKST